MNMSATEAGFSKTYLVNMAGLPTGSSANSIVQGKRVTTPPMPSWISSSPPHPHRYAGSQCCVSRMINYHGTATATCTNGKLTTTCSYNYDTCRATYATARAYLPSIGRFTSRHHLHSICVTCWFEGVGGGHLADVRLLSGRGGICIGDGWSRTHLGDLAS